MRRLLSTYQDLTFCKEYDLIRRFPYGVRTEFTDFEFSTENNVITWSYTVIMYSLWLSRQSRQFTRAMPIMDPAHRRRATHPELKDNDQIIDECKGEGVLLFSQIHRMLPRLLFNSEVSKSSSYGSATSYLKNFIVLPLHQTFYLRHCLSSRMKDVGYIFHWPLP